MAVRQQQPGAQPARRPPLPHLPRLHRDRAEFLSVPDDARSLTVTSLGKGHLHGVRSARNLVLVSVRGTAVLESGRLLLVPKPERPQRPASVQDGPQPAAALGAPAAVASAFPSRACLPAARLPAGRSDPRPSPGPGAAGRLRRPRGRPQLPPRPGSGWRANEVTLSPQTLLRFSVYTPAAASSWVLTPGSVSAETGCFPPAPPQAQ